MGGKVPQPVRLEVIRKWLLGYPRDEIAKDVGIGTGTVTGIIQQCGQDDDADIDLLRGVAVELRARDLRVEDFAPLLRLKSLLEEKEVALGISKNSILFTEYKKFEAIIITLEVLCFKSEMPMEQFFECVFTLYSQVNNLGISVGRIPEYIETQKKEILRVQSETRDELEKKGVTMKLLKEYQADKPVYVSAFKELPKVEKERDDCRREFERVRKQYTDKVWEQKEDEFGWYADPEEMDKTIRELGSIQGGEHYVSRSSRNPGLKKILSDLYRYPSKYVDPIRKIIDSYDSSHGHGT
ncbi:MAG: hypothetical protein WBX01_02535 [Nitrososphaeraceae archaeon]